MALRVLCREQIDIKLCSDGKHIIASFFADEVEGEYYHRYAKYDISDFPNGLASAGDFKRFGINIIDIKSSRGY